MSAPEVGAVVVGAGIAGLAAALELQRERSEVFTVDASDRPGGVMRTDHAAGFVVERGPNTFQVKAPALHFLRERGLADALLKARPASRLRFVFREGRLRPVPASPLGWLRTPLLSRRAKLRLLAEPTIRRGDPSEESAGEFAARRLGPELAANLVGPLLTGIYAGDERQLGARAVLPTLTGYELRSGSIGVGWLRGALARGRPRGLPGTWSAGDGLGPFARRLAELLVESPALGTAVTSVHHDGRAWHVAMTGRTGFLELRSPRVVVAAPARAAAEILRGVDGELADALAGIEYAPLLSVALGVTPSDLRTPIEGFGFLVARDEGIGLLGCLFMSRLFPGRAPAGSELLQCLVGGVRWPEAVDLPDDVVLKRLFADLERTLGLAGEPRLLAISRWPRAVPQPDREHIRRIEGIRARLSRYPGLALAGSYLDGVSVADTLASGVRATQSLLAPH